MRQQVASGSGDDPIELLKRLAELRESGVLTGEEFDQQKQTLMARM
jgi:hypothetical protein